MAIKVLADPHPADDVLRRFEDEARILGMVRDRALLEVHPLCRLGEHWAVVMEFVPGANCRELVETYGPLPAKAALEIVAEVARALHHAHHQPGPTGAPLGVIHRDLKPSNLQITRAGVVKVLDFGGAAVDTNDAEAVSKLHGTYGYIAPERLRGIESPAVDTYALGMVLFRLLTAEPTNRKQISDLASRMRGARGFGLQLAAEMCALEPHDRPSLRDVAIRCGGLIGRMDGPTLAEWAAAHVPDQTETTDDPMCGRVLRASEPTPPPAPVRKAPTRRAWRSLVAGARRRLRFAPAILVLGLLGACAWAAATVLGPRVAEWNLERQTAEQEAGLDPSAAQPAPSERP